MMHLTYCVFASNSHNSLSQRRHYCLHVYMCIYVFMYAHVHHLS